jgi:hypothetical protein
LKTAIIGTNNIFIDQATVQERANDFCKVTGCPSWLKVKKNLPAKGFIFCCNIDNAFIGKVRVKFVRKCYEEQAISLRLSLRF